MLEKSCAIHKLTMEAMWRLFWKKFLKWFSNKDTALDENKHYLTETIVSGFQTADQEVMHAVNKLALEIQTLALHVADFIAEVLSSPTSKYWLQYMEMVQTLLDFIRAEREGSWSLHLSAFAKMLP